MISTNSEMMRAKITPITVPIRLPMIQNRPPSGESAIKVSPDTMPERPNKAEMPTASQ